MQSITPHLWFETQAAEAAERYVSLFPGSAITSRTTLRNTPSGDCDVVSFQLAGQPFMAISAGPFCKPNPSVSFQIKCGTKEEVDTTWEKLAPGASVLMPLDAYPFSERFGWLEDEYGVSWQMIYTGGSPVRQRFTPVLMFTGNVCGKAEDAINFYLSVFRNAPAGDSAVGTNLDILSRYGAGEEPDPEGAIRYAQFSLLGQEFGAMDSAHPHNFAFNEAISFIVPCDTQEEIDYFWDTLSADPAAGQCGWLKDKFGVSWQVSPAALRKLLTGDDKQRIDRVTRAFLKMKKFDIATLESAAGE